MASKFDDITISDYTARSVVVQGDTRKYKEDLKKLGGKYNGRLKDGPGWIFPKTSEKDINAFIDGGKRLVTEEEAKEGEERSKQRAKEWAEKEKSPERASSVSSSSPTLGEFAALVNIIRGMEKKLDLIESAIMTIMTPTQFTDFNEKMKAKNSVVDKKVSKKVVKRKEPIMVAESDSGESEEEEKIPMKRLMRK